MKNLMKEILQILKDNYMLLVDLKMLVVQHIENKPKPLLNKSQVIALLGISDTTYRRYVREGRLKPMTLHGIDMYQQDDLMHELRESRRKGRTCPIPSQKR